VTRPPDQPPPGPLSAARTAALAGGLVALLAIVSVAARSGDHDRAVPGGSLGGSAVHHAFVWFLLVVFPIAAVIGLGLFLYAQVVRRRDPQLAGLRKQARLRRRILLAALVVLVAYSAATGQNPIVVLVNLLHDLFDNVSVRPFGNGSGPGGNAAQQAQARHSQGFATIDWVVAGLTWLLIVAGFVVAVRRMRRRREAPTAVRLERDDEPADIGVARLRSEPDPRRAVIGAYALMDRLMAERSLGRRRPEAPLEYLGRMTGAGYERITALGRLTRLYARARFSTHPVDREMQAEAVDAVESIAAETGE
jgi:hypothetical protein